MLTLERLKEVLSYSPETGLFTWIKRTAYATKIGDIAGCFDNKGYRLITIDKKPYKAHRLAWMYTYGAMPEGVVDHLDRNPDNNRIGNLRDTTYSKNAQNQKSTERKSKTTLIGAYKRGNRFESTIFANGSAKYLGSFGTAQEAHNAYLEAKVTLHS